MTGNRWATAVMSGLAAPITVRHDATLGRMFRLTRRTILRVADPTVTYSLDGTELDLPLSHDLPVNRGHHPAYSANLGVVAAAIHRHRRRDGPLLMIDVGANVGDSVAIVRAAVDAEVLCIEGDPVFLPYLRRNVREPWGIVEPTYVASADVELTGTSVRRHAGTARLVARDDHDTTAVARPVTDIVERHPRFATPDLVKIDTDGHDLGIVRAMSGWLARSTPAVFFELDPVLTSAVGGDVTEVLEVLRSAGYTRLAAYDNVGDPVGSFDLDDHGLPDRIRALGKPGACPYWDVVAVTDGDSAVLTELF